jgi:hypothetical protein
MIQLVKHSVWQNHKGQDVPREYVSAFDRKKEQALGSLLKKAEKINEMLTAFKVESFNVGDALYEAMLRDANINIDTRKGNYSVFSFDKSVKLEVNVSDRIEFDENIVFAQHKLNEFINEKTAGSDIELRELINNAFTTSKGRLDTKRILGLFSLKISHPLWVEAMELIKKSISTNNTVRYLTIAVRDEFGKYEQVNLNFSNL